jgi:tetratricopeptide (TPR) repeat protein
MKFLDVKCPSCGGDLKVPEDRSTFICGYCGTSIMVRNAADTGGADPENLMKLASIYLDQGNYEDAEVNYDKVLEIDSRNYLAWAGKLIIKVKKFDGYSSDINNIISIYNTSRGCCVNDADKEGVDSVLIALYEGIKIRSVVFHGEPERSLIDWYAEPVLLAILSNNPISLCALESLIEYSYHNLLYAKNKNDEYLAIKYYEKYAEYISMRKQIEPKFDDSKYKNVIDWANEVKTEKDLREKLGKEKNERSAKLWRNKHSLLFALLVAMIILLGIGALIWITYSIAHSKAESNNNPQQISNAHFYKDGNLYGFVDNHGQIKIKPKYISFRPFQACMAAVQLNSTAWTFIDTEGNQLSEAFQEVKDFTTVWSYAIADVKIGGKWKYIDRFGNEIHSEVIGNKEKGLSFEDDTYNVVEFESLDYRAHPVGNIYPVFPDMYRENPMYQVMPVKVSIALQIDSIGDVINIVDCTVGPVPKAFKENARKAVESVKWVPAINNRKKVRSWLLIDIVFKLTD